MLDDFLPIHNLHIISFDSGLYTVLFFCQWQSFLRHCKKIFGLFCTTFKEKNRYFSCIFIVKTEKFSRRFAVHLFIYILFKFSVQKSFFEGTKKFFCAKSFLGLFVHVQRWLVQQKHWVYISLM